MLPVLVQCLTVDTVLIPMTVALNWQHWDAGTMMNEAMFAGSGGYMLKPPGYRGDAKNPNEKDVTPARYTVDLSIEVFAGQNIPLPPGEKKAKVFEPYVKCELHVELPEERKADAVPGGAKAKDGEYKRRTKKSRGQNPDFGRETIEFRGMQSVVPELTFVRYASLFSFLSLRVWRSPVASCQDTCFSRHACPTLCNGSIGYAAWGRTAACKLCARGWPSKSRSGDYFVRWSNCHGGVVSDLQRAEADVTIDTSYSIIST